MSKTYGYLVTWQWVLVMVFALYSWLQSPESIAGLLGSLVGAYVLIAGAAYINRNRERPTEATEAQRQ